MLCWIHYKYSCLCHGQHYSVFFKNKNYLFTNHYPNNNVACYNPWGLQHGFRLILSSMTSRKCTGIAIYIHAKTEFDVVGVGGRRKEKNVTSRKLLLCSQMEFHWFPRFHVANLQFASCLYYFLWIACSILHSMLPWILSQKLILIAINTCVFFLLILFLFLSFGISKYVFGFFLSTSWFWLPIYLKTSLSLNSFLALRSNTSLRFVYTIECFVQGYIVLNRPWAFVQWLEKAVIEEEYVTCARNCKIIFISHAWS